MNVGTISTLGIPKSRDFIIQWETINPEVIDGILHSSVSILQTEIISDVVNENCNTRLSHVIVIMSNYYASIRTLSYVMWHNPFHD